ncbi:MAG: reverse transcriptase-like protein [Solirubrobacteraceae bacterium]
MAGLAYESALLGSRTALVPCSDITLAEHLALLMAMRDAASRLPGRVVFRVDSAAVVGPLRRDYPDLAEAKRQIADLLKQHPDWSLLLVERERNWLAHNLANKPLRKL